MERVDFYVLASSDARERWKFACGVADKAFQAEQRVLVCFDNESDLQAFDDLLWTFADDAFVPHEAISAESDWEEAPVLLSAGIPPPSAADVLINLSATVPAAAATTPSVMEIIDADPARRQTGRVRYKQYREQGITPTTHNVGS